MRILYVTYFWTTVRDVITENSDPEKGMPGFVKPIIELKKRGYSIDYVFISSEMEDQKLLEDYSGEGFISKKEIKGYVYFNADKRIKKLVSIKRFSKSLFSMVDDLLSTIKYDFVYGQSQFSRPATVAAKKHGVPCGQRQYGTFMWGFFQKHGFLRTIFFDPLEFLSYNTKKDFLLTTNDGTNGDKVQKKFCLAKKPYDFYFWVNGVQRFNEITEEEIDFFFNENNLHRDSLFYLGRIAGWKRQDRAIRTIYELKKRGKEIHLYLVGQIAPSDKKWYAELNELADELGVQELVHFLGAFDRYQNALMAKGTVASLLMYDVTNLGNVFHELFADGAVIIGWNDGTLDGYIKDSINGFVVSSESQAAERILKVLDSKETSRSISLAAKNTSCSIMKSWEQRIEDEICLIERLVEAHE